MSSDTVLRVRQLVNEAAWRVAAQRELIDQMTRDREDRDTVRIANEVLQTFENTLDTLRRYLQLVQQSEREGGPK